MGFNLPRLIPTKKFLKRSFSNSSSSNYSATAIDVQKGHLAVYVGESEKKRFVVPMTLLRQSSFQELLIQVEDEFGFDHSMGGLTIPCTEEVFLNLISSFSA